MLLPDLCPIFFKDGYKCSHPDQYPDDVTMVVSNWTPRSSRIPGQTDVTHLGPQMFIKEILINQFKRNFFGRSRADVVSEYHDFMLEYIGSPNTGVERIGALWDLGYLPLKIYSIPEGFPTPLNVPSMVLTNTLPEFYWLPNSFETALSMFIWKPSTSATTARRLRQLAVKWALKAGERDLSYIDWQFHDFSMRGMSGMDDCILSGVGHLTSFSGTDTIPAIFAAKEYYGARPGVGGSVNATEHAVMEAGGTGPSEEFATYHRLLTTVYPNGILSVVSDTWDLWRVLVEHIPALKEVIVVRDNKLVIRPDSGDPVKIILGNPEFVDVAHSYNWDSKLHPAATGVLRLLGEVMGYVPNPTGTLPLIRKAAAIYGDGINEDRADRILGGIVNDLKISPANQVFGIGSWAYEFVTRDNYGFAMKATAVVRSGKLIAVFKDPITDDGGKKSHRGVPAVYRRTDSTAAKPVYYVREESRLEDLDNCAFLKVFEDGKLLVEHTFDEIRARVRA